MKKISVKTAISALFILVLFSLSFAQNPEHITITTYYPSPFGSYRELTVSEGQAIGDVNNDGRVDQNDLAPGGDGTLTINRTLSIGTNNPQAPLHVVAEALGDNNVAFFNSADNMQTAILSINQFRGFRIQSSGPMGIDMSTPVVGSGLRINTAPPPGTDNAVEIGPELGLRGAFGNTLLVRGQNVTNTSVIRALNNEDEQLFIVRDNGRIGMGTEDLTSNVRLNINGTNMAGAIHAEGFPNTGGAIIEVVGESPGDSNRKGILSRIEGAGTAIAATANGTAISALSLDGTAIWAHSSVGLAIDAQSDVLMRRNVTINGTLDIGLEVVSVPGVGSAYADCTKVSKKLISGGCQSKSTTGLWASRPDGNSWYCSVGGSLDAATAYAICGRFK